MIYFGKKCANPKKKLSRSKSNSFTVRSTFLTALCERIVSVALTSRNHFVTSYLLKGSYYIKTPVDNRLYFFMQAAVSALKRVKLRQLDANVTLTIRYTM